MVRQCQRELRPAPGGRRKRALQLGLRRCRRLDAGCPAQSERALRGDLPVRYRPHLRLVLRRRAVHNPGRRPARPPHVRSALHLRRHPQDHSLGRDADERDLLSHALAPALRRALRLDGRLRNAEGIQRAEHLRVPRVRNARRTDRTRTGRRLHGGSRRGGSGGGVPGRRRGLQLPEPSRKRRAQVGVATRFDALLHLAAAADQPRRRRGTPGERLRGRAVRPGPGHERYSSTCRQTTSS